ncbi:MAG: hypothetical protein WCF17_16155 [Terracidiphilus sp.]
MSRSIVHRHNGQMLVKTGARPGHSGTVFAVLLPGSEAESRRKHDSRLERAARPRAA